MHPPATPWLLDDVEAPRRARGVAGAVTHRDLRGVAAAAQALDVVDAVVLHAGIVGHVQAVDADPHRAGVHAAVGIGEAGADVGAAPFADPRPVRRRHFGNARRLLVTAGALVAAVATVTAGGAFGQGLE